MWFLFQKCYFRIEVAFFSQNTAFHFFKGAIQMKIFVCVGGVGVASRKCKKAVG